MEALVRHLVAPIVQNPDAVSIQTVEAEATVLLELVVHPEDRDVFEADGGRTLRAVRTILSAAAGRRKASLDLVEAHSPEADEE